MIELYHNDMSVCAQKARFALAKKKLAWEGHHLNLRAGDQQKPEYLKLTTEPASSSRRLLTNTLMTPIRSRG